jgi:hypothetical protein
MEDTVKTAGSFADGMTRIIAASVAAFFFSSRGTAAKQITV